ncbi:MAG: sialidase family protein [Victivallales bacterium]|jgi:hypothetical protein
MALTLDATLATAQNSQSRHPLVEIISSQRTEDIPFDGSFLTGETFNEYGPNVIQHSSGRLGIAYCYGPDTGSISGIKYVYTDTSRTEFTTVSIPLYISVSYIMMGISLCEMTGGNIGLTYLVNDTGNHVYRLLRRIITVTGVAVSNAEIANWSHDIYTSDPWVATIAENSYLMVYGKKSGSNYYIYKRTSADFLTWSAESALSIAGLTSTMRLSNPSIVKISTGDLWLFFDVLESTGTGGEELTNIYYSISANSGVTWGTAVKLTAYTNYSEVGSHPVPIQKAANTMHLLFTRIVGALHANENSTNWPTGDKSAELSWDSVNRKLYVINVDGAYNALKSVVRINVDSWTVDKYWNTTTTPSFLAAGVDDGMGVCRTVHDGHHIVVFRGQNDYERWLWHLDGENDTITPFYLDSNLEKGISANVSNCPPHGAIIFAQVSEVTNKIYLITKDNYVYTHAIYIGYLDLTETSGYEYHALTTYTGFNETEIQGNDGLYIDTSGGYIVITGHTLLGGPTGTCAVFDLATGALVVKWQGSVDADFPAYGLRNPFVYNGKIYAGLYTYTSGYGQSGYRGLVEIDITSETIKTHRPSYCSDDDHAFGQPSLLQDGKIAMVHWGYGVAVYSTIDDTWELFGNSNIAGFTTDGNELAAFAQICYDDTNDLIMVGDAADKGVIMFSVHGYMRQAYYRVGTCSGGVWTFAAAAALCQGYLDYNAGACVELGSTSAMYVFWINEDVNAEKSIKWDKDGSSVDVSAYIIGEVSTEHTISGQPAKLTFAVSHGHLFDPYNISSLLSPILKKGRKLALRWGEKVSGTDYWQTSGTFFITGSSLNFERGVYPEMKVEAEDQRCLWTNGHVYTTDIYNNLPEDIIKSILYTLANIAYVDMNVPAFAGGTLLQMQWIETSLDEILNQVCERYGYYFRFDYQGKAHARQISNVATINHTYTDNTKLLKYTPDDKYSDFTNRVTVRGQEMSYTEVQFSEERITTLNGTIGWWGCKQDHKIYFSDDRSRRCIYPRLVALESAATIAMELSGQVHEWLEECGALDDDKFCTVWIEAPNCIPILIGALATYVAGLLIGDGVVAAVFYGYTIPIGRTIEGVGMVLICNVLGSMANFQYDIYACPVGNIRRSVQGTWNDLEHQSEIDAVVEQVIDDPLCYSVADCTAVAALEGMTAQMQRKRIMFEKVAHLQDEDGDTIRVVHPYSGRNIDVYIASLKRKFKKSEIDSNDGYFLDEIEGWVVS